MHCDYVDTKNPESLSTTIQKYREAILLASAGAYLHNLGKVSKEFNLNHLNGLEGKVYFYQQVAGVLRDLTKGSYLLKDVQDDIRETFGKPNDITSSVFQEDTQETLRKKFPKLMYPFNDRSYCPGDLIEFLGQGIPKWNKDGYKYNWARIYYTIGANKSNEVIKTIKKGKHKFYIEKLLGSTSLLTHLMNRCHHGASGGEKDKFCVSKHNSLFMATPFGFEYKNTDKDYSEYDQLRQKAEVVIKQRLNPNNDFSLEKLVSGLSPIFQEAMADSQRPFNNISVHDIGHSGMALLKSAIWTLKGKELTHDRFWVDEEKWLRWRLLRFSMDGLGYLSEAVSIADLRVRKNKWDQYLNSVKKLLEEQCPVATEVYRDENGSIFIFPDWEEHSTEVNCIKELINEKCEFNSKNSSKRSLSEMYGLEPTQQISVERCMAHPGEARNGEIYLGKTMQDMILNPLPVRPVLEEFSSCKKEEPQADLCPYCGLRLISKEVEARKTCADCLKERGKVAEKWWEDKGQGTIWLDEIADDNGRLALVVGRFFPECFIELDYLPDGKGNMYSAEAFARQRRIWETCRKFWQEIEKDIEKLVDTDKLRLCIKVTNMRKEGHLEHPELHKYHAYELLIDGNRLTAMWTGKDFITLENLRGFAQRNHLEQGAEAWLKKCKEKDKPVTIRIAGSYGSKTATWGQANIDKIETVDSRYFPAMALLTEPRTFMYLVPAQNALKIVDKIKSEYEKKMGQVRSRLPVHLGVIYANRYTPLRAILDAGQRMLNQNPRPTISKLIRDPQRADDKKIYLNWKIDGESTLVCWCKNLCTFGAPEINDDWYPYLAVHKLVGGERESLKLVKEAKLCYSDPIKRVDKMIHARELLEGDQVIIYPSTFDFEYLDSTGVRFEIAYEKEKRKSPDRAHRPYLLEQINELIEIQNVLKAGGLSRNQVYALRDAIAAKRQEWGLSVTSENEIFRQFCRDMLITANWNKVPLPEQKEFQYPWEYIGKDYEDFFDLWADYAVRGWFEDAVQLYLQIMKGEIG